MGIEVEYSLIGSAESHDKKELNKLKDQVGDSSGAADIDIDIDINNVKSYFDYEIFLIPLKAQLDSYVLPIYYFDMFFLAGQSQLKTDQGTISALTIGMGQRFYVSYNLSIRMDLKARFFSEKTGVEEKTVSRRLVNFSLGVSYML